MCELNILHDSLYQFCPELHLKRLNSLMLACRALLDSKKLTLTELGRNLPNQARTKHNIKRMDRLLGNRHLHKERLAVYRWHASFVCSGNPMPVVLVDWSDIREHKRLMALRASIALHGRSITLYEKAFPLSEQCSKSAHDQFLADLASILPPNVTPLIVSDAGFKVPWFKSVEKHGWFWLGRIRGKVQFAELGSENWDPISKLHTQASSRPKTLGYKKLTKSNPIHCHMALYKSLPKGRKNQRSTRTNCHHPSPKIYSTAYYQPIGLSAEEITLRRMIDEIHLQYPFMGSRRIRTELAKKGHSVNRKRVVRLMRDMGVGAIYPKPKTTLANKAHKVYPYLLRDIEVTYPNQAWAIDITYSVPGVQG